MDVQTIYQIFRACRLCGAGGGYKMPIIPTVVPMNFDCSDIELRQKIRECVQLEVSHDDKMPPLICELCVDKVNDFYEFLDMVRDVNRRTRTRLGLPLTPVTTQGASEGDCILGVTEPVYTIDDDDEPLVTRASQSTPRKSSRKDRGKKKKEKKDTKRPTRRSASAVVPKQELLSSDEDEQPLLVPRTTRSKEIKVEREGKVEPLILKISKPGLKSSKQPTVTVKVGPKSSKESPVTVKPEPKSSKESTVTVKAGPKSSKESPVTVKAGPKSSKVSIVTVKAGPKSSKESPATVKAGPKSSKESIVTVKAGPKSSKESPTTVKAGLKSSKESPATVKAGPKSSKESTAKPGPKSAKNALSKSTREPSPEPNSKFDSLMGSKSLKVVLSPGPMESKRPKSSPESVQTSLDRKKTKNHKLKNSCIICDHTAKNPQGLYAHMKSHTVGFTKPDEACNACGEWFPTTEEASAHHQWHRTGNRPYRCRRCKGVFKRNLAFTQHIENNRCVAWLMVPDLECPSCGTKVPTRPLLKDHDCPGRAKTAGQRKPEKAESSNSKKTASASAKNIKTKEKEATKEPKRTSSDDSIETYTRRTRRESMPTPVRTTRGSIATPNKTPKDTNDTPARITRKKSIDTPTKRTKTESLERETPSKRSRRDSIESPVVKKESAKKTKDANEIILVTSVKKKKEEVVKIPPSIRKRLRPMYVRLIRCDSLIGRAKKINVAHISQDFGFVKNCVYPYRLAPKSVTRKPKPVTRKPARWNSDNMVSIGLRNEFYKEEDYVHWDSDLSSEDEDDSEVRPKVKRVDSLTALSLKTIFSTRCLGKVPRKLRRIKPDKTLDSVFNIGDSYSENIVTKVDSIIDECDGIRKVSDSKLDNTVTIKASKEVAGEDNVKDSDSKFVDYDSDTMVGPEKERVTNDDFDSLFGARKDVSISSVDNIKPVSNSDVNGTEKASDSDATDASMNDTTDSIETNDKNNVEKSNLEGFDIDSVLNTDVVMTQATDIKESVTLNGDDKIDVNGSKYVGLTDIEGGNILKDIDPQIGVNETEKLSNKVLESDASERVNILTDDFDKSGSKYLDKVSDEEFDFDA